MELVVSARLTSPERVAIGVVSSSRGAGTETDSLTGWLPPTLRLSSRFISTSAPLNQNGGVNSISIGNNSSKQRTVSGITSATKNGKLNATYEKVVQQFDNYQNQRWYRSNSRNTTKQYQKLSQTRWLTKTRCGVDDKWQCERHDIQSIPNVHIILLLQQSLNIQI